MVNPLGLRQFSSSSSGIVSSVGRDNKDSLDTKKNRNTLLERYCGMHWQGDILQPYDKETLSQQSFRISLFAVLEEIMTYSICKVKLYQIDDLLLDRCDEYPELLALVNNIRFMQEYLAIETILDLILTAYPLNLVDICERQVFQNQDYIALMELTIEEMANLLSDVGDEADKQTLPCEQESLQNQVYIDLMQSTIEEMANLSSDVGDEADMQIVFLQTVANLIVPLVSSFQIAFLLQTSACETPTDFFSRQFQNLQALSGENLVIDSGSKAEYLTDMLAALPVLLEQKDALLQVFSDSPNMSRLHTELVNSYFLLLKDLWYETLDDFKDELCPLIEEKVIEVFPQFPFYKQVLTDSALNEVNVTRLFNKYLLSEVWKGESGMKV